MKEIAGKFRRRVVSPDPVISSQCRNHTSGLKVRTGSLDLNIKIRPGTRIFHDFGVALVYLGLFGFDGVLLCFDTGLRNLSILVCRFDLDRRLDFDGSLALFLSALSSRGRFLGGLGGLGDLVAWTLSWGRGSCRAIRG